MTDNLSKIYRWGRNWSRSGVLGTLLVITFISLSQPRVNLSVQLAIALLALLIGIPHGAIDHLVAIPKEPRTRFVIYIAGYVVIAILAAWAIATWNAVGFQIVVVMSALHFGFGDASFANEERDSLGLRRFPLLIETLYALPSGFLPVIVPLTNSDALAALNRINPQLDNWSGIYGSSIRTVVLVITFIAISIFLMKGYRELVIDLLLLAALSLLTPPLIAFAAYFGFWHALRHTARLVPKLERANQLSRDGRLRASIFAAITPGLYAVVGTFVIASLLMIQSPEKFSSSLLWSTLVIVWALTVPHMATTATFDWRSLRSNK